MSLILTAILGFTALVVAHELGHFLVARACGMRVLKFSVGFGPPLISWSRGQTQYQIALIPVGGFVQIAGLGNRIDALAPDSYLSRPLWQRTLMVFAGPAANYGLAILIYLSLIASFNLLTRPTNVLRKVEGPAAAAGLQPFDTIVEINGQAIGDFDDIRKAAGSSRGEPMTITVVRPPAGEQPPLVLKPASAAGKGTRTYVPEPKPEWPRVSIEVQPKKSSRGYVIGISPEMVRFGAETFGKSLTLAADQTWFVTATMVEDLWRVFAGREEAQLVSVVKITEVGADTVRQGVFDRFPKFLAIISINLFLLNLLPIPALDGGRLVFLAIEAVARRPVPQQLENAIHAVGMLLIAALILVVTVGDIASHFR